jgi:16S rRNA (cytosine1402-N4)-methyltransferase
LLCHGHLRLGPSHELLRGRADIKVLGIDQDADAISAALKKLAEFADRVRTRRQRFDQLDEALAEHGVTEISGAPFDLVVSSPQLDRLERGCSDRHNGPVDMPMDEQQWSAHDVVNGYERNDLARTIRTRVDKRFANRITDAIVAARPVESTTQLAEIVTSAIPAAARRTGGHPAKPTFRAIRIEVKSKLDALPDIAKQRFAVAVGACDCPRDLPCVCGAIQTVSIVRGIPKRASRPPHLQHGEERRVGIVMGPARTPPCPQHSPLNLLAGRTRAELDAAAIRVRQIAAQPAADALDAAR